jgi:hypothetical protein
MKNSIDLIHSSYLLGAVSSWPSFFSKVLRYVGYAKMATMIQVDKFSTGIFVRGLGDSSCSRSISSREIQLTLCQNILRSNTGGNF